MGKFVNTKDDGVYTCAACGNELFDSQTKFDSGVRVAELHRPGEHGERRAADGHEPRDGADGGRLRALRRAPRARLRRRPRARTASASASTRARWTSTSADARARGAPAPRAPRRRRDRRRTGRGWGSEPPLQHRRRRDAAGRRRRPAARGARRRRRRARHAARPTSCRTCSTATTRASSRGWARRRTRCRRWPTRSPRASTSSRARGRAAAARRRSSSSSLDWLRSWCGLPEGTEGILVSGGSIASLTALAAAREARPGRRVAVVSDQTHASVARALRLLGIEIRDAADRRRLPPARRTTSPRRSTTTRCASSPRRARRTPAPSIRSHEIARGRAATSGCTSTAPTARPRR